ncbi:MAG: amidohydrolase family protein [Planctomycetota bacterium]
MALLLTAPRVLCDPETYLDGGGLLVERGRIARVLRSRAAVRRANAARRVELEHGVLAPGLVNAHAHLELSGLGGQISGEGGFGAWVGALLAARAARSPRRLAADAERGARRLLETGTTTIGDIDTTGGGLRAAYSARTARAAGPRRVVFRELLDAWDPARTGPALAGVARGIRGGALLREGLSPHAPFTTSRALLAGAARVAARRRLPVTVHWSESEAEMQWLAAGEGPLAAVLAPSPRTSGLDLLDEAGLLGPRTALVHGNHPGRGEPARLAAAGCALVHCPGTHAFFGRAAFPLRRYLRAGVRVALGTDSLASNADLDLRRELLLVRRAYPWLAPEAALAMATTSAAAALGLGDEVGALRPGLRADAVHFAVEEGAAGHARALCEALTLDEPSAIARWVGGRAT